MSSAIISGVVFGSISTQTSVPLFTSTPNRLYFAKIHKDAIIPKKATSEAAGFDFYSPIDEKLDSKERKLIKSGIKTIIPKGYYLQLAPRSGLAFKNGIQVLAGVIDSDYRGEIGIILYNSGNEPFVIKKGAAICQGILFKLPELPVKELTVDEYDAESTIHSDERGTGGFGSTDSKLNTQ
jgi:dUTP pyrophosphatase